MGKIYYVMGKSASGKDTIYKRLVKELPELGTVRMYTTRPIRDGETNGVEYIFTDEKQLQAMKDAGKVIECRTYDTIYGPWSYFTADDGQINLGSGSYLMMGHWSLMKSSAVIMGQRSWSLYISMWKTVNVCSGH